MDQKEQQAFLDAIIAEPDDITSRLIYADWLEDHDDPRGEFIRIQCQLFTNGRFHNDNQLLQDREDELLEAHEEQWIQELNVDVGRDHQFERGFVHHFEIKATDFLKHGDSLLKATPLEWLRLPYLKNQVQKLATDNLLQPLQGFDLTGLKVADDELPLLFKSLKSLRRLRLCQSKVALNGVQGKLLVKSPFAKQLETLDLSSSRVEPDFFEALAKPKLRNLKSLSLGNEFATRPAHFDKKLFPALEHLRVVAPCRVADAEQLSFLPPLKTISFRWAALPAKGIQKMAEAGLFSQAEKIEFNNSNLTDRAVNMLLDSDLSNCRCLIVMGNDKLTESGWDAIANSPALENLETLVVGYQERSEEQKAAMSRFQVFEWSNLWE